jgi:hypothetical protein
MKPFFRHVLFYTFACCLSVSLQSQDIELRMFQILSKDSDPFGFCFLRGQEGFSTFPALLVVIRPSKQSSTLQIGYEYIELDQLSRRVHRYIKHPQLFKPKTIECPKIITDALSHAKIDLSYSEKRLGFYWPWPDDGTVLKYFFKRDGSEIYINDLPNRYENLESLERLIECEIEKYSKPGLLHCPPAP